MMVKDTVQELKSGLMALSMKANGALTRLMEEVNSGTLTVMSTRVSGKTIRPMALASTCT